MINYNIFHGKNVNIQKRTINERNYTYQSLISIFFKHFVLNKKHFRVLDLGCGVGTVDFYLSSIGFKVVGIDISSRAIKLAKKSLREMNSNNVSFFCTKIEDFDTTERFDYVIMSEVIEHIENPEKIIEKALRLTNSEGIFVISTPLSSAPLYRWGLLKQFDKDVGHIRRYSREEIVNIMSRHHLDIVDTFETEGLFRNLLFTNKLFSFLLKFARWPVSEAFNFIDKMTLWIFGSSNIYLVCRKR